MVIDEDGERLGVMSPDEARRLAFEKGLDLVEVAPGARPPVCRIMDYGRFRYEQRKRTKKQKQIQTKIIKLRPKTDPHDLETKLSHARRFLDGGDRVRFVVRMRGRERAVTERWIQQLRELTAKLDDVGVVSGRPLLEGGGVTVTVEPKAKPKEETKEAATPRPPRPAAKADGETPSTEADSSAPEAADEASEAADESPAAEAAADAAPAAPAEEASATPDEDSKS